jgi:hypothetical protein
MRHLSDDLDLQSYFPIWRKLRQAQSTSMPYFSVITLITAGTPIFCESMAQDMSGKYL